MTVRPPEIVQTSAMDCGPASLAALLGAHGLTANVDALREVCATAVDGTSVDDLEDVACALGLDAEQVVVPFEQVVALAEAYLPAILLTRTPDGYVHFVVAWRVRNGRVDLVDPAVGRRRVRVEALAREAFVHELEVPLDVWAGYALGDESAEALVQRLRSGGASEERARARVEYARRLGPVDGIGALLTEFAPADRPVVQPAGEDGDGAPVVRVRGAVLVRAPRLRDGAQVPRWLEHVLAAPRVTPSSQLRALVSTQSGAIGLAAGLAALAGCAVVAETVSAQRVLESGAGGGRLGGLALAVTLALLASIAYLAAAFAAGRRIERRLRELLLARVVRLGDGYVRSRPAGDLAERGHAIVLVRAAVELGTRALQRIVEAVVASAVIVVLAPAAWPAAVALAALSLLAPGMLARRLEEADLRARSSQGAIALQISDALGAGRRAARPRRGAGAARVARPAVVGLGGGRRCRAAPLCGRRARGRARGTARRRRRGGTRSPRRRGSRRRASRRRARVRRDDVRSGPRAHRAAHDSVAQRAGPRLGAARRWACGSGSRRRARRDRQRGQRSTCAG